MKKAGLGAFFILVTLACLPVWATLIQEDFQGFPVQGGVPAGWFEGYSGPGASWEVIEDNGNRLLKAVSGPSSGGGDAISGPQNGEPWFVENLELQVSLNIQSGRGGGVGLGQFDGNAYVGNAYYVEVSVAQQAIGLVEEGLSAGSRPLCLLSPFALSYNQWYDLRFISTGTAFQVYFRPHSAAPWQESEKIMDVAQDALHPGHKTYVEGTAGIYAQNGGGPSTVLFDDFRLEAAPFVPVSSFSDNFEDSAFTDENWSVVDATREFVTDGSQAVRLSADTGGGAGGIAIDSGAQFYTHAFSCSSNVYVNEGFSGGLFWGLEDTTNGDSDFHIEIGADAANIFVSLDEEQNSVGGGDETHLGYFNEATTGPGWYTVEVVADYRSYRVWFWKASDPKPVNPIIDVRQDMAHPGYRLMLLGAVGPWVNPGSPGVFDDFYFQGLKAPSQNTQEGSSVSVEPEPGLNLTFDAITESGTTTVETSSTAPGGGPGGLEFVGLYYDISTTAVYDGPIAICLSYDDAGMTPEQEANLTLMHWSTFNQTWENITKSVDTTNNVVCGETYSFSVFAIAVAPTVAGFLSPINMPPAAVSVFKQKSTIPVKFRLTDPATGGPVAGAGAIIRVQRVSDGVPSAVNETVVSTQPDGGNTFRYDAGSGQYIFNLSTRNMTPGMYRVYADIMGGLLDLWVDVAVR